MSVRLPNVVHLLNFEEEKNQLELIKTFPVPDEVLLLISDPSSETRFVAAHPTGKITSYTIEGDVLNAGLVQLEGKVTSVTWQKQLVATTKEALHVFDAEDISKVSSVLPMDRAITASTSDPHHAHLFAVTQDQDISIVDIRAKDTKSNIAHAHSDTILELDYNPNKPYSLVSAGKDCTIRLWDVRKSDNCLKCVQEHSHWVWQAKFNNFHDQLVISSSSDNKIVLHRLVSVSSTPVDESFYDRESDAVLMKLEDFNESVYSLAWSAAEAWFFAAASFDGKVGVFQVPSEEKYRILL